MAMPLNATAGRHALRGSGSAVFRLSLSLLEHGFDDGGLFGGAGAEVAGAGFDGGVVEQGLDLGDVGAALAQAGAVGVAEFVGAQAGQFRCQNGARALSQ